MSGNDGMRGGSNPRINKTLKELLGSSVSSDGLMFNSVMFDEHLAFAKYGRMLRTIDQIAQMLETVRANASAMFPKFAASSAVRVTCVSIADFARSARTKMYGLNADINALPASFDDMDQQIWNGTTFRALYDGMMHSSIIKVIIRVCDELTPYKSHLADENHLTGCFLEAMPGVSFTPFADFDVKDAYIQTSSESAREFLLLFLHKLYTYGYKLYQDYIAPDINVDEVSSVITGALAQLRKEPELSRCTQAFKLVEDSMEQLRANFATYYIDYVQAGSPTLIFENFLLDVMHLNEQRKHKRNPLLMHQFNKILGYYRAAAARKGHLSRDVESILNRGLDYTAMLNLQHLGHKNAESSAPPPSAPPSSPAPPPSAPAPSVPPQP